MRLFGTVVVVNVEAVAGVVVVETAVGARREVRYLAVKECTHDPKSVRGSYPFLALNSTEILLNAPSVASVALPTTKNTPVQPQSPSSLGSRCLLVVSSLYPAGVCPPVCPRSVRSQTQYASSKLAANYCARSKFAPN